MSGYYNQYNNQGTWPTLNEQGRVVPRGAKPLVPIRCIFVAQGGYVAQVRRSYEAAAYEDTINELQNVINGSTQLGNNGQVNMLQLGKVAGEMLRPSVQIEQYVGIENGWETPRLSFYMEFETTNIDGSATRSCYTGFTNYAGITWDGAIDPDMRLHITSMYQYRIYQQRNGVWNHQILSNNNVIVHERHYAANPNEFRNNIMMGTPNNTAREYLLDPASVYLAERREYAMMNKDLDGTPVYFADGVVSSLAQGVGRNYSNPSYWLSNMVNTMAAHKNYSANSAWGEDSMMFDGNAIQQANIHSELKGSNYQLDADPLFRLYDKHTSILNDATLLFSDLKEFIPGIDDDAVCTIVFPENLLQRGTDVSGALSNQVTENMDATSWAESTIEALVATSIVQQLPNLMLSEFIKSARFTVTNQMGNMFDHGRYGWVFGSSNYSSWENRTAVIFMSEHDEHTGLRRLENFKLRTESTLLDALFPDGEVGFSLSVDIDVFGGYSVVVSIDGAPEQVFTTPAYISPYVSPIITRDQTKLSTIGTTLVGAINDVLR